VVFCRGITENHCLFTKFSDEILVSQPADHNDKKKLDSYGSEQIHPQKLSQSMKKLVGY